MKENIQPSSVDVSLVIVNWNTRSDLKSCLRSFSKHSGSLCLETIVVDNASQDGSAQMVRSQYAYVRLIDNSENRGFAGGVNQGLREATGKYILVLNADIITQEGALEGLVDTLESSSDVGAVAPRLVNADGSLQKNYFRKFPSIPQIVLFYTTLWKYSFRFPLLIQKYFEETRDEQLPFYDVEQIPGGCIMVRREVVESVGLMDEQFVLFFEDVDWCYRITAAGWKLRVVNGVSMIHLGGRSFAGRDATWMNGRFMLSLNQFVDKHKSFWFRFFTKLVTLGNSASIVLIRMIQGFLVKSSKEKKSFQESYRSHMYLLKLFLEHYLAYRFSKGAVENESL